MSKTVTVELDDKLERYLTRLGQTQRRPADEVGKNMMQDANHDRVRQLHAQYMDSELTFRQMAQQLGLEYRQLYALLEELHLPVA